MDGWLYGIFVGAALTVATGMATPKAAIVQAGLIALLVVIVRVTVS